MQRVWTRFGARERLVARRSGWFSETSGKSGFGAALPQHVVFERQDHHNQQQHRHGSWRRLPGLDASWSSRGLCTSTQSGKKEPRIVTIGDVTYEGPAPEKTELVPQGYNEREFGASAGQECLQHLRWMLQKDKLGQDMFLLGSPGPARRHLALRYAEITQREVEYLSITRDTTESDLKQRRELDSGTAKFVDQAPVRAALHGRLLILDGIEKAERNVLPTLNNLLENREMELMDGRFLVAGDRYQELLESGMVGENHKHLISAHPNFRVIALGLPVPTYPGKPLDPPLRSRFQVRVVNPLKPGDMWGDLFYSISRSSKIDNSEQLSSEPDKNPRLLNLCSVASSLQRMEEVWNVEPAENSEAIVGMPHFPERALESLSVLAHHFQEDSLGALLCRSYPFINKDLPLPREQHAYQKACNVLFQDGEVANMLLGQKERLELGTVYSLEGISKHETMQGVGKFSFASSSSSSNSETIQLEGRIGPNFTSNLERNEGVSNNGRKFHAIERHKKLLTAMSQDHCVERDIIILGEPGCGKSRLVEQFGHKLGYDTQLFSLYKDMSARDLLQRRTTNSEGSTGWDDSPLVSAAIRGDLLVLDGIDRVDAETLTIIQRLIHDREVDLFDGRRIKAHENFRVVGLATCSRSGATSSKGESKWLTSELLSMFSFHHLERLDPAEQELVVRSCFEQVPSKFLGLLRHFSLSLVDQDVIDSSSKRGGGKNSSASTKAESLGVEPLSTRQVMRLCRFANSFPNRALGEMRERLKNILLGHFLPLSQRKGLEQLMDHVGIPPEESDDLGQDIEIKVDSDKVQIGDVVAQVTKPEHPQLVPSPLFFDIPKHKQVLRDILEDVVSGERFILLIGNQGVGKNKLADRMLELTQREREYIQLHRDSTVGSLTLSPSLKNGIVVWEDSPLVRAAIRGRVLMIDEVDKAPLEVVSVLKGLIEDEELLLADGRRIVSQHRYDSSVQKDNLVPMHPNFSIFALANRPGWPFQGNSFFAAVGDIFSSHVISNPDAASELELLQSYAPSVDPSVLKKLVAAFGDLRVLVEDGILVYPYSARECVAIAKHLEQFPQDGLVAAIEDVIGFDSYDRQLLDVIISVFQRHGIPIVSSRSSSGSNSPGGKNLKIAVASPKPLGPGVETEEWTTS